MSPRIRAIVTHLVAVAVGLLGSGLVPDEPSAVVCPPCPVVDVAPPVVAPAVVPAPEG